MLTLEDVVAARSRIAALIRETCVLEVGRLADTSTRLLLKLESLQFTGSFKVRGAANCLALLSPEERARGVIAASAGNHAQGLAAAARSTGVAATIVMPEPTPLVKVDRTRQLGATVVLAGTSFEQALQAARALEAEQGLVFVHPFADERVIAGQGTLALEILEQAPAVTSVIVPVGGGGLAGGVALALKERAPHVTVYGVQTAAMPAMARSLHEGRAVAVPARPTIAEGIAVGQPAELNLALLRRYLDDIVAVDEAQIATAMLRLLEDHKLVTEGAGAAPFAALDALAERLGECVVLIVSGGNADVTTLGTVIDRGLAQAGRSVRLLVDLPDVPGALAGLAAVLSAVRANILEIFHNRQTGNVEVGQAEVELVLSTRGPAHVEEILQLLCVKGYNARRHAE